MEDKKFAVLIDPENISAKYINYILGEVTKYGIITYKRIYGDWTNPQTGKWRDALLEYSISPVQQFRNTVGKNATDSTMIIDAMDILYSDNVDGFCIVSSDSDFTRLAVRLKEAGKQVIGMGESKTPKSFRAACTVFTNLELLLEQEEEELCSQDPSSCAPTIVSRAVIESDIASIIAENDDRAKVTRLAEIGERLLKKYSDFDVRSYGYSTLSRFVHEMDRFDMTEFRGGIVVKLKNNVSRDKEIEQFAIKTVAAAGENGLEMASLGHRIHSNFPGFSVKDYGYSNFARFIHCIPGLEVADGKGTNKVVKLSGK